MIKTFFGGEHLKSYKNLSEDNPIIQPPLPQQVIIPLIQHTGCICDVLVKEGDKVKTGTKIGSSQKLISSCVHASISGTISKIINYSHPVLGSALSVVIESDGLDEPDEAIKPKNNTETFSKEVLLELIKDAGIAGLGGAAFPTQVKLNPPNPVDTLIINGVECEPYLTCDYSLMLEKTEDILKGVLILKKILGVDSVFIAIEDDKPRAIKEMQKQINDKMLGIKVFSLKTRYPQGAEKQLIKALTAKEVPPGKLPFDVQVVVHNVATAFAVYEAVYLGKPLYERVITVSGRILREPSNLKVRIGTKFSELINFCKGTTKPIGKIIMGGPMMGIAQFSDEVPVIKGTSGIIILSEKEAMDYAEQPCIKCGRCVNVCPARMLPHILSLCVESNRLNLASEYNPFDCIECGLCTYVCPAKRRILEQIRFIKLVSK